MNDDWIRRRIHCRSKRLRYARLLEGLFSEPLWFGDTLVWVRWSVEPSLERYCSLRPETKSVQIAQSICLYADLSAPKQKCYGELPRQSEFSQGPMPDQSCILLGNTAQMLAQ